MCRRKLIKDMGNVDMQRDAIVCQHHSLGFFLYSGMRNCILLIILSTASLIGLSQENNILPREYTAKKTNRAPVIDGRIEEGEWKNAPWSTPYVDISDSINPTPRLQTRCRMLWDDEYLYIAAKLEETDLWATLKKHDDIIYKDNDFEVFIDPNNDGAQYFEIEINALGTVMDLFMPKPYRKGGKPDMDWNTTGMKSAVYLEGTLNKNDDQDKYWSVEMAIPFSCLEREGRISRPERGSVWRINFSRVQWTLDKSGHSYEPRKKADGKRMPEDNWVWSPQGVINMHVPEKWGKVKFE